MSKYKILAIASDNFGCGKFRTIDPHINLFQKYPDLFEGNLASHENVYSYRNMYPDLLKNFDLIHIHKQFDGEGEFIQMCKYLGKKVIVDVDDHFVLGTQHPLYIMSVKEKWAEKVIRHLKYADAVTTTTDIYKNIIAKHNKNVFVLPNSISTIEPQFIPQENTSDRLRIGIVCGSSHLEDLKLLDGFINYFDEEELSKLQFVLCGYDIRGKKHILNEDGTKTIRDIDPEESVWYEYEKIFTNNYKIISPRYKDFLMKFEPNSEYDDLENESYRRCWTKPIDSYATHYNNIDVLLAPLIETEFNAVKSQLKVIEAGFFKKGIIASKFGPYTIDLKPMNSSGSNNLNLEGNSILIENRKGPKEWAKAIKSLLANPDALKTMGTNLYNTVKDEYSLDTTTDKRKDVYLGVLEK